MRRLLLTILLAALVVLAAYGQAEAHALVKSSDPANGATLAQAPTSVTITCTEAPDPQLSQLHVLDAAGKRVEQGPVRAVVGDPLSLRVALPALPNGVYTVSWRTVSAVDGHEASGAFSFGVGVSPLGAPLPAQGTVTAPPPPAPLGVLGHWLLYAGLSLLLGGAWVAVFAFPGLPKAFLPMLSVAWLVSLLGWVGIGIAERAGVAVGWGPFFSSSVGDALLVRVLPLGLAGIALGCAELLADRWQRAALLLVGLCAAAGMLLDALASHAASSTQPWLMVAAQWAHIVGVGIWIGGLAAVLVGVRGVPDETKARAVRRFSTVAGVALAVVALTGLVRAVDEVGAWSRLVSTLFGGTVLFKVALLLVLAGLGAINRYRHVPVVAKRLGGLRRIGAGELAVASLALAASALLVSLVPPSFMAAEAAAHPPPGLATDGSDYGTTVRVHLDVTPGVPGPNRFVVRVVDYDSNQPVPMAGVSLRFRMPSKPDIGDSTLVLQRAADGSYAGQGTNLSLLGQWQVTVVVERGVASVDVPLAVTVNGPQQEPPAQDTPEPACQDMPGMAMCGTPAAQSPGAQR